MIASLCAACQHRKEVVSGKGSRFLFCKLSQADRQFAKYPPQPVIRCQGYTPPVPPSPTARRGS